MKLPLCINSFKKMSKVNKPFGIEGVLHPPLKDVVENFKYENIEILIENGMISIGYDTLKDEILVEEFVGNLIAHWSFKNTINLTVNFNSSWEVNEKGNRNINLLISDVVNVNDRTTITTKQIKGRSYIIKSEEDSFSFADSLNIAKKALNNPNLSYVLKYYHEEGIEGAGKRYGIYKAIEQIDKTIGIKSLAKIADVSKKYISDLRSATQHKRHSKAGAPPSGYIILTDAECDIRARHLIEAYINSIE